MIDWNKPIETVEDGTDAREEYYRTEELAREAALPDERIAKMEWEE